MSSGTDIVNSNTARTVFACCYEHFWSLGVVTLAVLAYSLPNWTKLQLALSLPTILALLCWKLIPDSPKWLLNNGRCEEARRELLIAAKLNKLEEPPLNLEKYLSVRLAHPMFCIFYKPNYKFPMKPRKSIFKFQLQ